VSLHGMYSLDRAASRGPAYDRSIEHVISEQLLLNIVRAG